MKLEGERVGKVKYGKRRLSMRKKEIVGFAN